MKNSKLVLIAVGVAVLFPGYALGGDPAKVDWKSVPTQTLTLFWPAQSSYQWLLSAKHPGAHMVKKGMACVACHEGAEEKLGNKLVKANKLEPMPVKGKNGVIKLGIQIAYDDQNAYFRARWKTRNPYPGEAHPFQRFDGKKWKSYGYPKLDKVVQDGKQPGIYEDRFSIMIDDGSVPGFANQGCWLTCHDGERDMPNKPSKAVVQANPLFKALKKKDVRKYLPATRTDAMASWDQGKSIDEIKKLKADGTFLELMQWRAHRSNPVGMADDFYVLEYRNGDAGKNPFSSNVDKKKHQPKYMYDEKKVGKKAIRLQDIRNGGTALVREQNAVPFDPNAGWKKGDLIPKYVVSRTSAKGSAADNKQAKGTWDEGVWTVVWARSRNLTNSDDKMLKDGKVYNFGFAVHDDNITTRGHHISFPVKVGFGAKADIQATKLK